jgi:hypothetical protein
LISSIIIVRIVEIACAKIPTMTVESWVFLASFDRKYNILLTLTLFIALILPNRALYTSDGMGMHIKSTKEFSRGIQNLQMSVIQAVGALPENRLMNVRK